jgi:hypothetical protein
MFCVDWTYRYELAKLVYAVSDLFSGVQRVPYSQILELDQKITEMAVPPNLKIPPEGLNMEVDGPLLVMQRMIPVVCGEGSKIPPFSSSFCGAKLVSTYSPIIVRREKSRVLLKSDEDY